MFVKSCKFILLGSLFVFSALGLRAECDGWAVVINDVPSAICSVQTVELTMSVLNDTAELSTCTYLWFVKKPSATDYEQVSTSQTISYLFNEVGTYNLYAQAKPNECTDYALSPINSIVLYPTFVAGTIGREQTICYNSIPEPITELVTPSGGDGFYSRQWQFSLDGTNWTNISESINNSYEPSQALTQTTKYRVLYTNSCTSVTSNEVTIIVRAPHTSPIISSDLAALCYNENSATLTCITEASGNLDETFGYIWQVSTDGNSFVDINGATGMTYITPKQTTTKWYRIVATSLQGCGSIASPAVKIDVYPNLTANTIEGIDTICYNKKPGTLSQILAPTGGNGVFSYQWQSKTTGSWVSIEGATDTTYQPEALTTTTFYRLIATTSCGSVTSNEVGIYVLKDITAPAITSIEETVCYGFAPHLISIPALATCDVHDSLTYQWQKRTSDDWQDIPGATSLTYQPEAITIAHQYRVVATSIKGCGRRESNVRTVNVYDDLKISTIGTAPLCYMTRGNISVSATGEGDFYEYQWQDSTNGVWTDIQSSNAATYKTQPKGGGNYYYRCIVNPIIGCSPDTSAVIPVIVYDSITPGTISTTGADTICYGFVPATLSVVQPASGGDGVFSYQWMKRQEGTSVFSYIPEATNTTFSPSAVIKTTEYQLEVTNACDVKYTNIVKIYVRNEIQAPVLEEYPDTICYNTIPSPITVITLPTGGGDDSFAYQWEESVDGQVFSEIAGETTTTLQPNVLLNTQFYRLRASSVKQCGEVFSNVVKVNVYDSLQITSFSPDTLCYMTSTTISVAAFGGSDKFSYQWQDSVNGVWNTLVGATSASFETTPMVQGDYYYRCIVSSLKCENYSRISSVIKVSVYDALKPGTIAGVDSTCYGFSTDGPIHIDITPEGVGGNYSYQWQFFAEDSWHNIGGANSISYQPDPIYDGTNYRLQVSSRCDTLYTNNLFIRVNPLPDIQVIAGPDSVCYNQHETYSVEKLNSGFTYEWLLENGEGDLTTGVINTSSIDVLWKIPDSTDSVILRVTNDTTGCERDFKFGVAICNEQAPERTTIVRKINSDILVCKEDGQLFYQWGYTERMSQQEFVIDDSNHRYVLLPHTFDNINYDYWLTLRHTELSRCYSRSYYAPKNDTVIAPSIVSVSVPSFVSGRILIEIQNPDVEQINCSIYNLLGELVARYNLGDAQYISTTLPVMLHTGMYVMHVSMGEFVKSIKLIAE